MVGILLGMLLQSSAATPALSAQAACSQAMAVSVADGANTEICSGAENARMADAAQPGSTERTRQLQAAAGHYRRAATVSSAVQTRLLALNLLADVYDEKHLKDSKQTESVLREIAALTPDDPSPLYRLARLQEDEGFIDLAETTLLDIRHARLDDVEPNRVLAQFYARRVTALHKQDQQKDPQAPTNPGEPDERGIYRVGGSLPPPRRLDNPQYPLDAQGAGISGVVSVEVVIDPSGNVTDAKVVRSIPLLDDAALEAVRNWRYVPTLVNGQPVPVRSTVTVNFSLPPSAPRR